MDISNYRFIAHRGLYSEKDNIPENSLIAFDRAVKSNYAIELDVHLTKDNKLVVIHDNNLVRMTGVDKIVEDTNFDCIRELSLKETDYTVPTLEEVLDLVNGKVSLLIEVKNERKVGPLEKRLLEVLSKYNGEYIVQSFNPLSLLWFKKHAPNILRGQLSSKNLVEVKSWIKRFIVSNMLLNFITKPHFISYDIEYITLELTKKLKKNNRFLFGWIIINDQLLDKAKNICDGIIFESVVPFNQ